MMSLDEQIELVTERRRANWARPCPDPVVSRELAQELEELWARKREVDATSRNGPRELIVKRARVERELERTLSRAAS